MPVYLVTYDLNKETVRPNIVGIIKSYPGWARLSESSYAIETNQTPAQVYDRFKPILDQNDFFIVATLKKPVAGWHKNEVSDWLNNNLT